jgi:hypothetical protein
MRPVVRIETPSIVWNMDRLCDSMLFKGGENSIRLIQRNHKRRFAHLRQESFFPCHSYVAMIQAIILVLQLLSAKESSDCLKRTVNSIRRMMSKRREGLFSLLPLHHPHRSHAGYLAGNAGFMGNIYNFIYVLICFGRLFGNDLAAFGLQVNTLILKTGDHLIGGL